jgi:hypothetical protein
MSEVQKVKWLNSRTFARQGRAYGGPGLSGPAVIHDGMPDGIFDAPTPDVIAHLIKVTEHAAYLEWLKGHEHETA